MLALYVRLAWTDLGATLALSWPKLALSCPYVGPVLAYVGPMLGQRDGELC